MQDEFLFKRLEERKEQHSFRSLKSPSPQSIDFCSNDYLGMVRNQLITAIECKNEVLHRTGSTGSRLLSGNYPLIEEAEETIAQFHNAESALIFNSGYDANLGLLSCIPQRNDIVLFDSLSHASIRDGIRLSFATCHSFQHNDLNDLKKKLEIASKEKSGNCFIVTESLFSMDGDLAPLREINSICKKYDSKLIVDEAHATGVIGPKGEGLVQKYQMQKDVFARVHTFGKALGAHGAVVLGSKSLKEYLINFCRPLVYTTALPESSIHHILMSYSIFPRLNEERKKLQNLIELFQSLSFKHETLRSSTPIQGMIIPGNQEARSVAMKLQKGNFDVRPILYPTVPKGKERLRIVLHSFNSENEVRQLADES